MLLIVFNSKGTVMSKMNAGMGDVVFSPLYEVLRQRGVKVHFFRRVRRLELSANGTRVDKIWLQPQAQLKPGIADYDPFVPKLTNWPLLAERAQLEQLEGGDDLKHALGNGADDARGRELGLVRGAGGVPRVRERQGFRGRRLAVSVASIKGLCAEASTPGAGTSRR